MKAFIAAFTSRGKSVMNILLHPVGPIATEFSPYDPPDKPVRFYEILLFYIAFFASIATKIAASFNVSKIFLFPLRMTGLLFDMLILFILTFCLLIPPKFSASRLGLIIIILMYLLILLSVNV